MVFSIRIWGRCGLDDNGNAQGAISQYVKVSEYVDWIIENSNIQASVVWEPTTPNINENLMFNTETVPRTTATATQANKLSGGSQVTNPEMWKFLVQIGRITTTLLDSQGEETYHNGEYVKNINGICTGTIVGNKWVLTSADCCSDDFDSDPSGTSAAPKIWLNFGSTVSAMPPQEYQYFTTADSYFQLSVGPENIFIHPGANFKTLND